MKPVQTFAKTAPNRPSPSHVAPRRLGKFRRSRSGVGWACGATAWIVAACGGGSRSEGPVGGDFVVLRSEPANNSRLFLNQPLAFDFSNPVDLRSADLNTVNFEVFDSNGAPLTERPQGTFAIADTPGDSGAGRRLLFEPRFPTSDTFDDGGFRPGRRYIVQFASGGGVTTLRDAVSSRRLERPAAFEFATADGSTAVDLFLDTKSGGPRRAGFSVSRLENGVAPLNLLGQSAIEVRLEFDQPLNPSSENVPKRISADPLSRATPNPGRILLVYDPGTGQDEWIPATVDLVRNELDGATVVMRPIGVLPNNATIDVRVQDSLEDMAGESNVSDIAYDSRFASFRTSASLELQYDAVIEQFRAGSNSVDFAAPLLEPLAAVRDGGLVSTFDFDDSVSTLDFEPANGETTLDTNFAQLEGIGAEPINVTGGEFRLRSVNIPAGRVVRGVGPNPMVWSVTGDFRVDGWLRVDGGDGERSGSIGSANIPTPGGVGVCGGGSGGAGSPRTDRRSAQGEFGFGPGQRPGAGGLPGVGFCGLLTSNCTGSGGGGGSYSTQGDPEFNGASAAWGQWRGTGGTACGGVAGGPPGPRPFVDSRADNDFWGAGVNVAAGVRVRGELALPTAGAGGGGGGDRAGSCVIESPTFVTDAKGAGGGGGGGVLVIRALGRIIIGPQGRITANGGDGGGGQPNGSNNEGGGGGGGSGGMIVLMAAGGLFIERHGDTYAAGDTSFAISADGGIGEQSSFSGTTATDKYGHFENAAITGVIGGSAAGGFGGMGVVQIMVPAGDDAEQSGSFLDDNITFLSNGIRVSTAANRDLIGWRGWLDETGQARDDRGAPITRTDDGDIRPAPILLPLPYGPVSRARSRWIDLGAVERTPGTVGPNTVNVAVAPQPDYEFAGTVTSGADAGYVAWSAIGEPSVPIVVPLVAFDGLRTDERFAGAAAYRVRVRDAGFAAVEDHRYAHYRAEVFGASSAAVGEFRILGHARIAGSSDSFMYLDPEAALSTESGQLRVIAKFFAISTGNTAGLGAFNPGVGKPRANVRIGFAFHVDASGGDPLQRYPRTGFSSDVESLLQQMRQDGSRPTQVQWDVLFNQRFGDLSPLTSGVPQQTLEYLILPFRF